MHRGRPCNLCEFQFKTAQAVAIAVAMLGNFLVNNVLTYRDLRLEGWRFVTGLVSFCLVCTVGAVANWGAATILFEEVRFPSWLASAAGAVIGSVWNFALSGVTIWRKRTKG